MKNLTEELKTCHKQLEEYKNRDKERRQTFIDFCTNIRTEIGKLQKAVTIQVFEIMKNARMSSGIITPCIQETLSKRYDAVDSILEIALELSVPLTYQCLMHAAENGIKSDYSLPTSLTEEYTQEDLGKITNQVKTDCLEIIKDENVRDFFKKSARQLRKKEQKILDYKKRFKNQILMIDEFIVEKVIPKVPSNVVFNFIKWLNIVTLINILG